MAGVAFLGNSPWSVPSLQALVRSSHEVAVVITHPPRPAGRGSRPSPTEVAAAARALGLRLLEAETVCSGPGLEALSKARPEFLAVVAYGEILLREILDLPRRAAVNIHFSLLPKLRGAAPVQRALLEGIEVTGVSSMLMAEKLDSGDILLQREEAIGAEDDVGSLGARLAVVGAEVLVETLDRLSGGTLTPRPQAEAEASFAPKIRGRGLDWSVDARLLVRLVRALSPEPGASTAFREGTLKVFRAEVAEGSGEPGTVLDAGKDGFVVAAGTGAVRPLDVAPAGRKRMSGADFVRGYRIEPGERLT